MPWSMMFTVPSGEPALAAARTVTVNVIGWPSVPALTASFVSVAASRGVLAATSTALRGERSRSRRQEQSQTGRGGLQGSQS